MLLMSAIFLQETKNVLTHGFKKAGYGTWIKKPQEQGDFNLGVFPAELLNTPVATTATTGASGTR